jgi:hypothetical protein
MAFRDFENLSVNNDSAALEICFKIVAMQGFGAAIRRNEYVSHRNRATDSADVWQPEPGGAFLQP